MKMYLCTRPQLAALLQSNGHPSRKTVNPWKPNMDAWLFDLNADTARIVADHYRTIGLHVPPNIERYLIEGE